MASAGGELGWAPVGPAGERSSTLGARRVKSKRADDDPAAAARLAHAVNALKQNRPEMSAARPVTLGQRVSFAAILFAIVAISMHVPSAGHGLALAALAVPFAFVAMIRIVALLRLWLKREGIVSAAAKIPETSEDLLPSYSLLVPLYKEGEVVEDLIAALEALDYPKDRLEIFFITEASDQATRAALENHLRAPFTRVLTVPEGTPRTKPRALNYALTFASGELVTVFDAEDAPDPGQLKAAAGAFRTGGEDLACVQARLNIYNPGSNFFTRQFTLEYSALFDGILPALEGLRLPIPLGGTSNHFPRAVLESVGAWDPYNVTEDADLGLRLARLGLCTKMLESVTWEEAPATAKAWLGQRTRWIKGWMQTYLVHMRSPKRLLEDLGAWRFFGFQLIFGGLILSALVHPLIFVMAFAKWAWGGVTWMPATSIEAGLWSLAVFNLAVSYVSAMALAATAVAQRKEANFIRATLGIPIYWLAISAAAYVAVYEFVRRPHHWAKTAHTGDGRKRVGI